VELLETLAITLIVITTIGLAPIQKMEVAESSVEMQRLSGTVTLSTETAMDALGLSEFKRGALATIDLQTDPVRSPCEGCGEWTGWRLHGSVVITNLVDDAGRLGRVEATMTATYLLLRNETGAIDREASHLIWTAGGETTELWSIAIHDPSRWWIDGRSDASFVEDGANKRSRNGPHLTVTTLADGDERVVGCLPGSFACTSLTTPDVELTRHMAPIQVTTAIDPPAEWESIAVPKDSAAAVLRLEGIRSSFGSGTPVTPDSVFCLWPGSTASSGDAIRIDGNQGVSLAPLSTHLIALGLDAPSFRLSSGIWTEADVGGASCGSLIDDDGRLHIAMAIR